MRFNSLKELQSVLMLLSRAYNEDDSVIDSFKQEEYTLLSGERHIGIVFKASCFSKSCLDLRLLADYDIVEKDLLNVGNGGKEINHVAISWANVRILRQLHLPLDELNLANKLRSIGYKHELLKKKEILAEISPGRIRESFFVNKPIADELYRPCAAELVSGIFDYL